jgi:hypothetical protein
MNVNMNVSMSMNMNVTINDIFFKFRCVIPILGRSDVGIDLTFDIMSNSIKDLDLLSD